MIPVSHLLRLLQHLLGEYDEASFEQHMSDGFVFYPSGLDMQDRAVLARVASGEAWEAWK